MRRCYRTWWSFKTFVTLSLDDRSRGNNRRHSVDVIAGADWSIFYGLNTLVVRKTGESCTDWIDLMKLKDYQITSPQNPDIGDKQDKWIIKFAWNISGKKSSLGYKIAPNIYRHDSWLMNNKKIGLFLQGTIRWIEKKILKKCTKKTFTSSSSLFYLLFSWGSSFSFSVRVLLYSIEYGWWGRCSPAMHLHGNSLYRPVIFPLWSIK